MSFNAKTGAFFGNASKAVNVAPVPVTPGSRLGALYGKVQTSFNGLTDKMGDNTGIIIASIIIIFLFVAVIIFITRELLGRNIYKKTKSFVDKVVNMNEMDAPIMIEGSKLPESEGNQYTVGFWTYLTGYSQTPGVHKLVLYRGEGASIQEANPIVMMDETNNKLHFVVKTIGSSLSASDSKIVYKQLKPITDRNLFLNKSLRTDDIDINRHLIMTVSSVPLNRWVHFAISVKDNVVTLFQDGGIHSVKTTGDFKQMKPLELDQRGDVKKFFKEDLTISPSSGSFYVGRNPAIAAKNSYMGYFSKLDYASYAMTVGDVYAVYKQGPYPSTILKKVGIDNYGLRSPVFKLTTDV